MALCHAVVLVVAVVIAVVFVSSVLLTPSLHQPLLVFSGQFWKNKNSFEIHSGCISCVSFPLHLTQYVFLVTGVQPVHV